MNIDIDDDSQPQPPTTSTKLSSKLSSNALARTAELTHAKSMQKEQLERSIAQLDLSIPPNEEGTALCFHTRLHKLCAVDCAAGSITVDIAIYCRWNDPRIVALPVTEHAIGHMELSGVWQPEWVLHDLVEEPLVTSKAVTLRDANLGTLEQYCRMRATVECSMELANFPFDKQAFQLFVRVPRHHHQGVS